MKKSLSTLILVSIVAMFVLPIAIPVCAATTSEGLITEPIQVVEFIKKIGTWFVTILLAVAGILIALAAWTFLTAGGNPDSVTKARQMLVFALVGVAVAVLAAGLPYLIENFIKDAAQ